MDLDRHPTHAVVAQSFCGFLNSAYEIKINFSGGVVFCADPEHTRRMEQIRKCARIDCESPPTVVVGLIRPPRTVHRVCEQCAQELHASNKVLVALPGSKK